MGWICGGDRVNCPYINPSIQQCLNCNIAECNGSKDINTAEKQRKHYYRHITKMRKYHREYARANYDTAKNTVKCRKYRLANIEKKRQYDRERYLRKKA